MLINVSKNSALVNFNFHSNNADFRKVILTLHPQFTDKRKFLYSFSLG